ncbi:hypothetical protein ACFQ8X_40645, partial [Embleya sp. NPDC056538]
MTTGIKTVIHPVPDLAEAKELYGRILGVDPVTDESYHVGHHLEPDRSHPGGPSPERRGPRAREPPTARPTPPVGVG